jgi:hypothetical protein
MQYSKLIEPFPESDIEWRIGQVGKGDKGIWAKAFAYITARAIADRLDEVCGPDKWTTKYEILKNELHHPIAVLCTLSILTENGWVGKTNGSEVTDTEPFKGGISAALKRAGSDWGIGRYLYKLDAEYVEIFSGNGKPNKEWNYQKHKEHGVFFWKPKPLPNWALPKKEPNENTQQSTPIEEQPKQIEPAKNPSVISTEQAKAILDHALSRGWTKDDLQFFIKSTFKFNSSLDIPASRFNEMLRAIDENTAV